MKTNIIAAVVILLVLGVGAFYFIKTRGFVNNPSSPSETTSQTSETSYIVKIENFTFNPNILSVKAGTTVTWINKDQEDHSINSFYFNSPVLKQGEKFEF